MSSNFCVKFAIQIQFRIATKIILSSKLRCEPDYISDSEIKIGQIMTNNSNDNNSDIIIMTNNNGLNIFCIERTNNCRLTVIYFTKLCVA